LANSESPFQWTEIIAQYVFSPLERTSAISQGFEPLAGDATGATSQVYPKFSVVSLRFAKLNLIFV
jgi:hypothetical protein